MLHSQEPADVSKRRGSDADWRMGPENWLSRDTLRFCEKMGLISAPQRQSSSGYKEYDDATVERLTLITQAKALGFTLSEIKEEVEVWQNHHVSSIDKIEIMKSKIDQIDVKIQQFCDTRGYLIGKINQLQQSFFE